MQTEAPMATGTAIRLDYKGKKLGDYPRKETLGTLKIDGSLSLEEMELALRKQFPAANWAQFHLSDGKWIASTSL